MRLHRSGGCVALACPIVVQMFRTRGIAAWRRRRKRHGCRLQQLEGFNFSYVGHRDCSIVFFGKARENSVGFGPAVSISTTMKQSWSFIAADCSIKMPSGNYRVDPTLNDKLDRSLEFSV